MINSLSKMSMYGEHVTPGDNAFHVPDGLTPNTIPHLYWEIHPPHNAHLIFDPCFHLTPALYPLG